MIYVYINDDARTVQAMRVPRLFEIDARVQFDFWLSSLKGRRLFVWRQGGIAFGAYEWRVGDWIVADAMTEHGDTVFLKYSDAAFDKKFARVG